MKTGRPSKYPRSLFGERLHTAREAAGLSQAQVAAKLGVTQTAYAVWERHPVALRPEQIEQVARVLGINAEQLFGASDAKRRAGGPTGKLRQIFEQANLLSRSQQEKLIAVLQPFVAQHNERRKAG